MSTSVQIDEHFFRHESGRLLAALTRIFGMHNLAMAEDVVQDAFCRALDVWKMRGLPENPSAWLMTTAKNRALDMLRRERTAHTFAPSSAAYWKVNGLLRRWSRNCSPRTRSKMTCYG
jgi:predicted RNA polymerase sigma factor